MDQPSQPNESAFLRRQIQDLAVRLEDKIAELSVVKEMGQALGTIEDFAKTCRVILDVVLRNTLAQNFSIMLLDHRAERLYLVAASDPEYNDFVVDVADLLAGRNLRHSFAVGQGVAGRAIAERRPILVADTSKAPDFSTELETRVTVGSLLCVPMLVKGRPIGVINASHRLPGKFRQSDLYLFGILADLIALLVESSLAHQRLRLSEEKYRVLAENASDGIAILQDGGHVYTNPRYRQLTGCTEDELAQRDFDTIFSASAPHFRPPAGGDGVQEGARLVKGVLTARDGRQMEVEASLTPIRHQGREALLLAVRDLSYRTYLERQLRQLQKMEAIGTLAGGIAHDFNNVLAAMLGYAELANRRLAKDDPVHPYLAQILTAGQRAKELVRRILTFSRQTEQERAVIAIDPIIKESLKLLRSTIPTNVSIQAEIAADCLVLADPTHIQQIVMNLAINASHAMQPEGGTMTVSLQRQEISADAGVPQTPPPQEGARALTPMHGGVPPGAYVVLSVADTGCGMDEKTMERIFEPYFTTKEKGVGTGMGLAVVHGIVQGYGGCIRVASTPGQGSTFTVYLPMAGGRSRVAPTEETGTAGGKERILFVDDEESLAVMGAELLGGLGYRVTAVSTPSQALKLLQQEPFDLLFTDEYMPGMTGSQLAAVVAAMRPGLPVILCSGNVASLDQESLSAAGVRRVVAKPFSAKEADRVIRAVLAGE